MTIPKSIVLIVGAFYVSCHNQQLPQDLMHVLLEGVFRVHVNELLKYLVEAISYTTLANINHRIMTYPYAYFEEKSGPLKNLDPYGSQSGNGYWLYDYI